MKIAINGFGRIGRAAFKIAHEQPGVKIVAINDLTDTKTLAHLLKYDTVYRNYVPAVNYDEKNIMIDQAKYPVYAIKDPALLPWGELGVDVVLECTGRFTKLEEASLHLKAGAKKVVISAPAKGVPTYVLGVNADQWQAEEKVISNASCTTNSLAPAVKVLHEVFGVKKAIMSTVHSYTADQNLVDGPHKDLRRARAAAQNIVPTTTGAAIAVTETITDLKGLFDGLALRVPTVAVSLSDVTMVLAKKVTVAEVNQALAAAAQGELKGILAVTNEELVSSDLIGNNASSIVDLSLTKVVDGDLVKIICWYDNEWGYSVRLVEIAEMIGKK
ncbi:MAG: type I glyceraldehyde-3-phosphate dehydrogenase [Candidatus Buchananbacteria bacterium]